MKKKDLANCNVQIGSNLFDLIIIIIDIIIIIEM